MGGCGHKLTPTTQSRTKPVMNVVGVNQCFVCVNPGYGFLLFFFSSLLSPLLAAAGGLSFSNGSTLAR